jgi:predicted RNase H-like nuclease
MTICIIGIDCATDPKKIGLARGFVSSDGLIVDKLTKVTAGQTVSDVVIQWIDANTKTLLAIDAPLGWPSTLGEQLIGHSAGDVIRTESNNLFRRYTDRFIKQEIGKQPLDVGADRIARTAHAALKLLNEISSIKGDQIPLAWDPDSILKISAIEVYPAATLKTSGIRSDGYKKKENTEQKREISTELSKVIEFQTDTSIMLVDDDVLDAAVCIFAGYHFLTNQCIKPNDADLAKKEGWIWVKK